ncbi:MAG: hydroxymethylglutaryl-CoA lyase [Opitutae bacterium]|nr:hydroxymethylglutaryl-CoA lyase [Opitutae bacterium]
MNPTPPASRTPPFDVLVREVGPRDGLQSIARTMPTEAKHRWITALAASGLRTIEAGSFVSPKLLPQMADAAAIVRQALTIPGLAVAALAPNLRGARDAFAAGAPELVLTVSASNEHSLANVRMTTEQAVAEAKKICEWRGALPADQRPFVGVALSTSFGCSLSGPVSEDRVVALAVQLAAGGADAVHLADTVGYANPVQVKRLTARVKRELGGKLGAGHFHNTRGQGLANAVAALEAGVTALDSSLGGLGGCPYAPGATGNIVTEDLVFLLESMGLRTGIDLEKLIAARAIVAAALPGEPLYGHLADAGLPKGFVYAATARS